jgi:probable rRNA maturation factor
VPAFVSIRNGPFRDVSRAVLRRWAERMLVDLDLSEAELSVAVTDDDEIRELNRVFRHRDKATDVLAFAMREGHQMGGAASPTTERRTKKRVRELLGDVVVSVETARRQAKEHRRTLDEEMRMLLAHGLLHLVGYDHQTDREEAVMNAATDRLCRAATAKSAKARATADEGTQSRSAKPAAKSRTVAGTKRAAKSRARAAAPVRNSGSKNGTSARAASRKAAR